MSVTTEFQVTGMTCGHCETAVRDELSQVDGVEQIDVSAKTGRLVITSAGALSDADVVRAVDEAGYEAVRL